MVSSGLASVSDPISTDVEMIPVSISSPTTTDPSLKTPRSVVTVTEQASVTEKFTVLTPKSFSPLLTNKASTSHPLLPIPNPLTPLVSTQLPVSTTSDTPPSSSNVQAGDFTSEDPTQTLPLPQKAAPSGRPAPVTAHKSLADRLRKSADRSLKRLAPVTLTESGRPTTHIPDQVFHRGAEAHKDFVVCYFNGRPPLYHQIQSVLNHLWGKGHRLEIHVNHLTRSMLVRIPNEFIRKKVLEKCMWYIGDSMFHTAAWGSHSSSVSPALDSIPIWINMFDVPLNLRTKEGISLVSGLVGEPKETDDFTLNLVNLKVSHAKVLVDLTKPLPDVVQFTRDDGKVVKIKIDYPWLPPTCSHCNELGHVIRNCLHLPPPKATDPIIKQDKGSGGSS